MIKEHLVPKTKRYLPTVTMKNNMNGEKKNEEFYSKTLINTDNEGNISQKIENP